MSVGFCKTGIVSASGMTSDDIFVILTDEFNNYLVDESGNYLVSIIWNEQGFVEGTEIMSIYEGVISAREFIEY